MTNTQPSEDEIDKILPILDEGFGSDGRMTREEAKQAIQDLITRAKIEVLERVKGMGVWTDDIDNPNNHFVWSWKFDREITELQNQLNNKEVTNENR